MKSKSSEARRKPGRPRVVDRDEVAEVGLRLFCEHGFGETTMAEIAAAANISRKTLFQYFPSKADIVWNRFRPQLADLGRALGEAADDQPTAFVLRDATLEALHTRGRDLSIMHAEVALIETEPALQAYAYMQGGPWRRTLAEFVAAREGLGVDSVLPQIFGHAFWQVLFVAFRAWLNSGDADPRMYVERAVGDLAVALLHAFDKE